jgi:hypothetical protein
MTKKHSEKDPTVYEEGARAPKPGRSLRPDPVHTGDPADEPKQPYGLTETMDDRGTRTGHHDGVEHQKKR